MREVGRPRQLATLESAGVQQVGLGLVVEFGREQQFADLPVSAAEIDVARRTRRARPSTRRMPRGCAPAATARHQT